MAEPHWTSYVGMITGLIGAVLGVMGYRKANEIKSLDLRLESRKAINDCTSAISKAKELLPHANQSRERIAAASGGYRSGAMQIWKQQYEQDSTKLSELANKVPSSEMNYDSLSPKQLESKLVEIHALQNEIDLVIKKYQSAVDEDDKTSEHIRSRH